MALRTIRWMIPKALRSQGDRELETELKQTPPSEVTKANPEPPVDQGTQISLRLQFQQLARIGGPLPDFREVEFRAYSQTGEDGILLMIFSVIGTTDRRGVEFCAGNGIECNSANLVINHGWSALMVDGDDEKLNIGRAFYASRPETRMFRPRLVCHWLTPDNVNGFLLGQGYDGEIDLLSLDIDGNDYWLWKAIDVIEPRVVILEYEAAWGPQRRRTQRYIKDFDWRKVNVEPGLPAAGASLAAYASLAKEKGYRLVGCNANCFNAIFIKEGIGEEFFPEVPVSDCFDNPMQAYRAAMLEEKEDRLPDMWIEI